MGKTKTVDQVKSKSAEDQTMGDDAATADKTEGEPRTKKKPVRKPSKTRTPSVVNSISSDDDTHHLSDSQMSGSIRSGQSAARGRRKVQTGSGTIVERRPHSASPIRYFHCCDPDCLSTGLRANIRRHIKSQHPRYANNIPELRRCNTELEKQIKEEKEMKKMTAKMRLEANDELSRRQRAVHKKDDHSKIQNWMSERGSLIDLEADLYLSSTPVPSLMGDKLPELDGGKDRFSIPSTTVSYGYH